jgi:hypothetical protein
VYLYHRVHFLGHALAENKQRSGWRFGGRERREAGRKAHDGQHGQHDVTLPVAVFLPVSVSVADRKPVTGSDGHSDRMIQTWASREAVDRNLSDDQRATAAVIIRKSASRSTCPPR